MFVSPISTLFCKTFAASCRHVWAWLLSAATRLLCRASDPSDLYSDALPVVTLNIKVLDWKPKKPHQTSEKKKLTVYSLKSDNGWPTIAKTWSSDKNLGPRRCTNASVVEKVTFSNHAQGLHVRFDSVIEEHTLNHSILPDVFADLSCIPVVEDRPGIFCKAGWFEGEMENTIGWTGDRWLPLMARTQVRRRDRGSSRKTLGGNVQST